MFDTHLPFYGYVYGTLKEAVLAATNGLPPEAAWLPLLVMFILAAAAAVDALTSSVPDPLVFLGLLAVTAAQGMYVSWPFAAWHLTVALFSAILIWGINQVWYQITKRDALGMGDAKWTMLAVACFDVTPVLIAWGFGACLALIWMGFVRIARFQITRVYFAPFLFFGLMAGIYWVRIR